MTVSDKIQSLRQTIGAKYKRPEQEKLDQFKEKLFNKEDGAKALEYLEKERGLSRDTIKHFSLGYDPNRNAIAIPIYKNGELINIKYRLLGESKSKYISERGAEVWIFNEDGISKGLSKGGVLIVEGEFDCISAWQAGFTNVVSPSFGKDSYGVWLEAIDSIPRVFIAYDNDEAGKNASRKLAERIGVDKTREVSYPEGIKDANEYFKKYTRDDFRILLKESRPYFTYQFKGLGDVIESLRNDTGDRINIKFLQGVELEKDWLVIVSGQSNVGKTGYILNLADDLIKQDIGVLIMPFERGIESVGKRFLQVKFNLPLEGFRGLQDAEWKNIISECIDAPIYFALPNRNSIIDTIEKSKRLFNTKVVIIDHLDYIIRNVKGSKEAEIGNTLQELKRVAEENEIVIIIVTHIRKIDSAGAALRRKPNIEDLKGSSSLYQDPECVIMLTADNDFSLSVNVLKNKGKMENKTYGFNRDTGKLSVEYTAEDINDDW